MIFGYMRVSRDTQTTLLQEDALRAVHCDRTFTDVVSGALDTAREPSLMMVLRTPERHGIACVRSPGPKHTLCSSKASHDQWDA
jgi:hypothetical protein